MIFSLYVSLIFCVDLIVYMLSSLFFPDRNVRSLFQIFVQSFDFILADYVWNNEKLDFKLTCILTFIFGILPIINILFIIMLVMIWLFILVRWYFKYMNFDFIKKLKDKKEG